MQIDIQARDIVLTTSLREHVERRLSFALARISDRLRRANVHLSDVNGPRGGIDKRCRVLLRVQGMSDIVIENTESDLHAAIDRCADRAQRALVRQLDRARAEFQPRSDHQAAFAAD